MRMRTKLYWVITGYGAAMTVVAAMIHNHLVFALCPLTILEWYLASYHTEIDEKILKGE